MEINGIAHTMLTSGDFARARAFYGKLLPLLGLTPVVDTADTYYCVGGKTAFGIRASERQTPDNRFDQAACGLHHLCFRMRRREDVDELYRFLLEADVHYRVVKKFIADIKVRALGQEVMESLTPGQ